MGKCIILRTLPNGNMSAKQPTFVSDESMRPYRGPDKASVGVHSWGIPPRTSPMLQAGYVVPC